MIAFGNFNTLANWQAVKLNQIEKGGLEFGTPQVQITVPTITASPRLIAALFQGEKSNGAAVFNKAIAQDFVEPFEFKPTKKASMSVAVKTRIDLYEKRCRNSRRLGPCSQE